MKQGRGVQTYLILGILDVCKTISDLHAWVSSSIKSQSYDLRPKQILKHDSGWFVDQVNCCNSQNYTMDAACSFEQILEAAPYKTVAI